MREDSISVTDDGMVVEQMMNVPVKLYEGSYENIQNYHAGRSEIRKSISI